MTEKTAGRPVPMLLETVAAEIESFIASTGWDGGPTLFALVRTRALVADPAAAAVLGAPPGGEFSEDDISDEAITPIAQEELPTGPLDESLAQIGWPPEVIGCALSQHILMLPSSAEAELSDSLTPELVAAHPDRREARLVVAVLRNGNTAALLRLRGTTANADELLTGPEIAPNLVAALASTLAE